MPPVYDQNVPLGAVRCVGVGVCQTSQCTPDVGILVSTCRMTRRVRCRHRRSVTCVLYVLSTRRVWCRRRRSSTVVLHVLSPSCDLYAMNKSITVLPRDPYVLSTEITPIVYQFRPDKRVRSCFLLSVWSCFLLVLLTLTVLP